MTIFVQQLYPVSGGEQQLHGLYLQQQLHTIGTKQKPFVYANFVTSLDGRIAVTDRQGNSQVPTTLTTAADWQLFQELQAQADCFITHGGYLKALAAGRLDNILQVGTTQDNSHLLDWRRANGLPEQPVIVVASAQLNFPPPASVKHYQQPFYIVTGHAAERVKIRAWQNKGYQVIFAGSREHAEGKPLLEFISKLGCRSVYLQAGPLILETMLRDRMLDRLYLTQSQQLIGGDIFDTLLSGKMLHDSGRLKLRSLYYDHQSELQTGQLFSCYDVVK